MRRTLWRRIAVPPALHRPPRQAYATSPCNRQPCPAGARCSATSTSGSPSPCSWPDFWCCGGSHSRARPGATAPPPGRGHPLRVRRRGLARRRRGAHQARHARHPARGHFLHYGARRVPGALEPARAGARHRRRAGRRTSSAAPRDLGRARGLSLGCRQHAHDFRDQAYRALHRVPALERQQPARHPLGHAALQRAALRRASALARHDDGARHELVGRAGPAVGRACQEPRGAVLVAPRRVRLGGGRPIPAVRGQVRGHQPRHPALEHQPAVGARLGDRGVRRAGRWHRSTLLAGDRGIPPHGRGRGRDRARLGAQPGAPALAGGGGPGKRPLRRGPGVRSGGDGGRRREGPTRGHPAEHARLVARRGRDGAVRGIRRGRPGARAPGRVALGGCAHPRAARLPRRGRRGAVARDTVRMNPARPFLATLLVALAARSAPGQRIAASQHGSVTQRVGHTDIGVSYNRPVARGRTLFGDLVRWGRIWHPGADSATTITFSRDVTITGHDIPAGRYTLWTIPEEPPKPWTVILSRGVDVWHTQYPGESLDALRISIAPEQGTHMEVLAFYFPIVAPDSTVLHLHWGTTIVPITIRTK